MSHFGALAAASSRYAALCGTADPRTIPWYWGRLQPQMTQDKSSPNGKLDIDVLIFKSYQNWQ